MTADTTTGVFADEALAALVAGPDPFADEDVVAIRAASEQRAAAREPGPAMADVRDVVVPADAAGPARPARLYRPDGAAADAPLVLYLHGGGWTIGSITTFDRAVRRLAAGSGRPVLSLGYRLAPEDPWPASLDDTVAALTWIASGPGALGGRPRGVVVAGDSAGGTLAALACLRLRDEAPHALPDLQVLVYANADLAEGEVGAPRPSMVEKATGFGLEAASVRFFAHTWVPDPARRADPGVSPLRAADLRGLPATVVVTAEHDPLRDGAEAYAARLADAGVPVTVRREPGMIHNFLLFEPLSGAARDAADRVAGDLATHG